MKHLPTFRIPSTPPGVGGVLSRLLVSERKKSGLLVSENPKIGIWSGRRPKIFRDLRLQIQSKTLFFYGKLHSPSAKYKKNPPAAGNNSECTLLHDLIVHQIPIILCPRSKYRRSCWCRSYSWILLYSYTPSLVDVKTYWEKR